VKMMVGRDISGFYKKDAAHHHTLGPVVLEVEHYSDGHRVRDVSFQLHAGEVLGLAGLVGSGRTEVARLIFGADRKTSGALRVKGKPIDIGGPAEAIAAGIVYLTEDRKNQGVFLDMSVHDNINLAVFGRDARLA
ncbi:sugar ABC transporter ATP-binding protein, partial [Mycobacterium tuberculosis]|nr:sugar ABC transporter ATP-binding protein [Mycobacterium tuberculosis]